MNTDAAFGAGSDARIAGLPRSANPYSYLHEFYLRLAWAEGWKDADRNWGLCDPRARRLPVVAEGVT